MNKIVVTCPNNNIPERKYIITLILQKYISGLELEIKFADVSDYILSFGEKKIVIEDHFFNKYPKDLEYLHVKNIPSHVEKLFVSSEMYFPIIYGRDKYEVTETLIICGLDIFASSFFMLTRWEEEVLGRADIGKCDEEGLFVVKNNLYKKPIVNEYIEFLVKLLNMIGLNVAFKNKFQVILTHDVDRCYLTSWKEMFSNVKNKWKSGTKQNAITLLFDFIYYKLFDPYPFNTFEDFLTVSRSLNIKEEFYFKALIPDERGFTYSLNDDKVKKILRFLLTNERVILGFHPSESTFNDSSRFALECARFFTAVKSIKSNFYFGRNHGLFTNVEMIRYWEKNGFNRISNYGFQKRNGFRCGICFPFNYFDVYKRSVMDLEEIPFVAMDTVWLRNLPSRKQAFNDVINIIDEIKKYNGIFCINWHSNVFRMRKMIKYRNVYKKILRYVADN